MKCSTFKRSLNDFYYTLLHFDLHYHYSRAQRMLEKAHSLRHISDSELTQSVNAMRNNFLKGQLLYYSLGDLRITPSDFELEHLQLDRDLHVILYLLEQQGPSQHSSLFNSSYLRNSTEMKNLKDLVRCREQIPDLSWRELVAMNISRELGLKRRQITQIEENYQLYFKYMEFIVTPTKFYKHRRIEKKE